MKKKEKNSEETNVLFFWVSFVFKSLQKRRRYKSGTNTHTHKQKTGFGHFFFLCVLDILLFFSQKGSFISIEREKERNYK